MFSFQEYIIGWVIYLFSTVGLLFVFWHLTRNIPWFYFKQSVRLVMATLLLVPAAVEDADLYLAPAWIKGFLQLIFSGLEGFTPVARGLLISILLAFIIYLLLLIVQTLFRRKFPQNHDS